MLREVGTIGEGFVTARAFIWLWFSHVDLGVQLQVSFRGKNLGKINVKIREIYHCPGQLRGNEVLNSMDSFQ